MRAGGQEVLLLAADRARGRVHEQRPLILERAGEEAEGQLAGARFRETEDVDLRIDRYTGVKRAARATPRTTADYCCCASTICGRGLPELSVVIVSSV